MSNILDSKNKLKGKKLDRKVFLSLHIMPQGHESKDVRVFSWLTASILIVSSLIIFLMIYVQ